MPGYRAIAQQQWVSGTLPAELGRLAKLASLVLNGNDLSGEILAELGRLAKLESLVLNGNDLSGEILAELGCLVELQELKLAGNPQLTGCLPYPLRAVPSDVHGMLVCPTARQALTALYEAAGGANWETCTNWLSEQPLGEWHGVTMDRQGRVAGLRLDNNGLAGTPPAELGNLANLERLNLHDNELSGAIPVELGQLASLKNPNLADNKLTGAVPAELGQLSNLRELRLDSNALTGELPAELLGLPSLRLLWVYGSAGLTGCLPDARQGVVDTGGPNTLRCEDREARPHEPDWAALVALYDAAGGVNWRVSTNWLTRAPIADWHGVKTDESGRVVWLRLHNNRLRGVILAGLSGLTRLEVLDLSLNDLTGALPAELGCLVSLQELELYRNEFSGAIPAKWGDLASLQLLFLNGNDGLTGCIPRSLERRGLVIWTDGLPYCP